MPEQSEEWHRAKGPSAEWKNGGGGNRTRVREASELAFYTFSNPFMSYRRSFRLQNLAWPESLKSQSYIATM